MRSEDINNDLRGALCQLDQMAGHSANTTITEDMSVSAIVSRSLLDQKLTQPQNSKTSKSYVFQDKQSGSTLIISLVILVLLMLLGVTAMNTSDTQFKLASNLQFENIAMNNAETAANTAEQWLEAKAATIPSASAVASLPDPLSGMTWTTDSVQVASDDKKRYVIGYVSTNASPTAGLGLDCFSPSNAHNFDCVNTYLVTARGQSGRGATKFIQTYYAVPLK